KEEDTYAAAYVDTNGYLLDVQYGEELFVPLYGGDVPTKPGYEFDSWSFDAEVTEDIVITAVYALDADDVTVTVDGVPVDYAYNELVTVSSDLLGFTHWEDENGFIVSYSN